MSNKDPAAGELIRYAFYIMKKSIFSFLLISLFIFNSSCIKSERRGIQSDVSTVTTGTQEFISTDTVTPSPSLTVHPTHTFVPTLTSTPCAVFNKYSLHVGYPCSWTEVKENYFRDGDDYFRVERLDIFTDPLNACELLAFQYLDRFGGPPKIYPYGTGCLLVPRYYSGDFNDWNTAYVTSLENNEDNAGLIVLWTNSGSFDTSLKIISSHVYPTRHRFISSVDEPLPSSDGQSINYEIYQGLNYQEEVVKTKDHPISPGPETVRWFPSATNYSLYDEDQLEITNQQLSLFGYELKLEDIYDWKIDYSLYKDGELLLSDVQWFWHIPLTINESGTDFILPVSRNYYESDRSCIMVSNGKVNIIKDSPYSICWYSPFYIGDQLVTLHLENDSRLDVIIDDTSVQSYAINQYGLAFFPSPISISKFNDNWVLELNNKLIINGEMQNLELGYDEIYNWRFLKGKPFYFFRDQEKVYISFDNQTLPVSYDYVEHYNRSSGYRNTNQYNIYNTPSGVSFLVERDGIWRVVRLSSTGDE